MDARPGAPVLVVDDDEQVRTLFTRALERAGLPVRVARDGDEALAIVASEPVSVVLLDSRMPGLSGLDVLERLRASPQTRTLPVILVTGAVELDDRVRGLELGADDYVAKPVAIDELVARVRAQLRGRDAWEEVLAPLRRRAAAVETLSQLPPDSPVEDLAAQICSAFAQECDGASTYLHVFGSDRLAVPAAVQGDLGSSIKVGQPISRDAAAIVYASALGGPVVQDHRPVGIGDAGIRLSMERETAEVFHVLAPIMRERQLLGVLGMAAPAETSRPEARGELLAAAVDYASAASALIGSATAGYATRAQTRQDIERKIERREFTTHFQPVVDLETRETVGYEALTRWDDGSAPELPFRDAHEHGLGIECEHVTAEQALEATRVLPDGCWASVNMSPSSVLGNSGLGELCERAGRRVIVELTEHHPIDDYPRLLEAIDRLGIEVAVDDAGAGYASLHHILALRPDIVKIDLGWTRGIEHDRVRQAMVRGLSHFTSIAGCDLVAEGVETEDEYETLITLDVEFGQGFLFGPPAPVEATI